MTGAKKFNKVKNHFFHVRQPCEEFLKSVHTKALFPEPFSQKFEQLFPISETFFKKNF